MWTASDDAIRDVAADILMQPEFRRFREDPSWLTQLLRDQAERARAFFEWLGSLLPDWLTSWWEGFWSAFGLFFDGEYAAIRIVLGVVLSVAILAGLLLLVRALARGRARRRAQHEGGGETDVESAVLLARARELAGAGRWLEATHTVQLATLELLLRRRWLALERSEPNRTLRRRLADASLPSSLRDDLVGLLDRLEREWFRDRSADPQLYDLWTAMYETLDRLGPAPDAQAGAAAR